MRICRLLLPQSGIDFASRTDYFASMWQLFGQKRKWFPALCLWVMLPVTAFPEVRTWTGNGGDERWSNPLNWNGGGLPAASDEVILDNTGAPGTYRVILPDQAVTILALTISPSPGNQIELLLPSSNVQPDALVVTGPGYGILLNEGAVFRNSSGIASGESLHVADSIRINNGARYVHNTRASHAASILSVLATAPGTESGIFEFDVPRASYTISASNRVYGSLLLSSMAYGSVVNYTCSGSSPLHVRGDLRIGVQVNLSVNLSGAAGNIQVDGDFIQEGGVLNLASGTGNSTMLGIRGNFNQSPEAMISATSTAEPGLELNGSRVQQIAAGGAIAGSVVFQVNNPAGCELLQPLRLSYLLDLEQGRIVSTTGRELVLEAACGVRVDSARVAGPYVDGPLRKEGLSEGADFLFPVGKNGYLRWLELKGANGSFTVEYLNENPAALGGSMGSGIDHISGMEYWKLTAAGPATASVELSHASPQSGAITDPAFLHVAGLSAGEWFDAGQTALTGDMAYGSVVSRPLSDFSGGVFTLASTAPRENPLPLVIIQFDAGENNGYAAFSWTVQLPEEADYFELLELKENGDRLIERMPATTGKNYYDWQETEPLSPGLHYYRLRITGKENKIWLSKAVAIKYSGKRDLQLSWIPGPSGMSRVHFRSPDADRLEYSILSVNGQTVSRGEISLPAGDSDMILRDDLAPGIYQLLARNRNGKTYLLRFMKNRTGR
jgi:hypothetical protein